jgi:hypothetical protein
VRHPVHDLLAHHSWCGSQPSAAELDELHLAADDRAAVAKVGREVLFMYEGGDRGLAREHAAQRAHEIIAALP